MPHTFKLARRLAQAHLAALAVILSGCGADHDGFSPPATSEVSELDGSRLTSFPGAATVGCNNEPAGFTTYTNQPWNALPPLPPKLDPFGWRTSTTNQSHLAVVQDPAAPATPGSVMRGTFWKGTRGGTGPFSFEFKFGKNATSVYWCVWNKLSTNFTNNGNVGTKFGFILSPYYSGATSINHFFNLTDYLAINLQSTNKVLNRTMLSTWRNMSHLGEWHKFEFLVISNTIGNSNGTARIWVDGSQVLNVTNVRYFLPSQTPRFVGLMWNPTYGGGTNPVPYDMFQWVDNWYVSGK